MIEDSQTAALRARDFVEDFVEKTLCCAGLQRHPSKGQFQVPSQVLHDHLGYEVNIPLNLLRVPERRCHTIRRLALALRGRKKKKQIDGRKGSCARSARCFFQKIEAALHVESGP